MKTIDFTHNGSEVLGRSTATLERILLDRRYSAGMRLVAAWALGQSITWVFRVGDIQQRLGLTRGQWRTLAVEMREAGFMAQRKEVLPGESIPTHCLVFNFTIFDGCQHHDPSREWLKTATRARGCGQPLARGLVDDHLNQGFKKPLLNKPPPQGGGEKEVDQDEGEVRGQLAAIVQGVGLNAAEVGRFSKASTGASPAQLALLVVQLPRAMRLARDKAAVAVTLAKTAAAGGLTGQAAQPAPGAILAQLDGLDGWVLAGPNGPLALIEGRALRALREPGRPLFHPAQAVEIVAAWKAGALDCQQQGDPAQLGRGAGPQALRTKKAGAALALPPRPS